MLVMEIMQAVAERKQDMDNALHRG
jgi:hypothetical protein